MHYAGIGSRNTPKHILDIMTKAAAKLESLGYVLRSGGADGADSAFEKGVSSTDNKQIYYASTPVSPIAHDSVDQYHPCPQKLSGYARKLMARNHCQLFGNDPEDARSLFVICWTPRYTKNSDGGHIDGWGGTGQAIRIAAANDIPIRNLNDPEHLDSIKEWLEK